MTCVSAQVIFGTFTPSEVLTLFSSESSDLEVLYIVPLTPSHPHTLTHWQFGWQKKKQNCLHGSLLVTPDKLAPKSYNQGGASPNLPLKPPTTPVSVVTSRGTSPAPLSRLNANAPPFIPGSSPEPGNGTGGTERDLSSVRSALEESLATPTNQTHPPVGSEFTPESSAPIQTVHPVTPPTYSVEISSSEPSVDAPPTPTQSPTSHPHTITQVTSPVAMETPSKPKSWASIVSKSGSGSQIVTTPTGGGVAAAVKSEGDLSDKERAGAGAGGEGVNSEQKPSAHLITLGG